MHSEEVYVHMNVNSGFGGDDSGSDGGSRGGSRDITVDGDGGCSIGIGHGSR